VVYFVQLSKEITMTEFNKKNIRQGTVRLVCRLLTVLIDSGTVSQSEYDVIRRNLNSLAKTGELALPIEPKLLTPQEVAELLAISYSQFRALEKENVFPFKRVMIGSKTVRYRNSDVIRYIETGDALGKGGEVSI
jgi:excisionase family DNA binding protein